MIESLDDGVACTGCWDDPEVTRIIAYPHRPEVSPFDANQQFDEMLTDERPEPRIGRQACCYKCGAWVSSALPRGAVEQATVSSGGPPNGEVRCGRCDLAPFSFARCCGAYSGALEASILLLKVDPRICRRLKQIIATAYRMSRAVLTSDLIAPVPLHPGRRRERGFNQAELIAGVIAGESGIPMSGSLLLRTKYTERHRAGQDASERARSVDEAFRVKSPAHVSGRSVLLVDDLYTTGSTVSAAARELLKSGAERVNVFTIARVE